MVYNMIIVIVSDKTEEFLNLLFDDFGMCISH